jgi:hypothetical protein
MVGDYDQLENTTKFLEDCTNSLYNSYQDDETETTSSPPECVGVQPGSLKVTITALTQDDINWGVEVLTEDGFEHDNNAVESKKCFTSS